MSYPSQEKAPPMVVNGTSCSIIRWLFAIYDFQIMRSETARTAKQMRTRIHKAVTGRSYKGAEASGGAYVRWTIWGIPALARELGEVRHLAGLRPSSMDSA